jgi:DHA2 family multidrug resistance protein
MQSMENENKPFYATGIMRWLIVLSVMLVAVIEVLDTTIVNVALSPMMGALGATRDQITWVLTSYIVSAAIVMPLTGYLVTRIGRKRLLLMNIVGFMITSLLCGLSTNLTQIVIFRVCQGLFGASLIPISQYVLLDTFAPSERGKAMAIWGIGIMVGPIFGPTLGGYITESLNWRWIFFINLPVCIVAFLLAMEVIQETPIKKIKTDWVGLFLMVLAVGCLQIFLDRGHTEDWFESHEIIILFVIMIFSATIFIVRGLNRTDNIINLRLFADPNFSKCCILIVVFIAGFFSIIALQPIMVQQLMGYPADVAGILMAPRGISSAFAMIIVGKFISRVDPRFFIATGLVLASATSYLMCGFTLQTSFHVMAMVTLTQGLGVGFFFVPLSVMAFSTLKPEQNAEAAGLFSFGRNLGTSIGISLVSTYLARMSQINWNYLSSRLSESNPNLQYWLQKQNLSTTDVKTIAFFSREIARQSSMVGFVNAFWVISMAFLVMIPLVLLLKKPAVIHAAMIE